MHMDTPEHSGWDSGFRWGVIVGLIIGAVAAFVAYAAIT